MPSKKSKKRPWWPRYPADYWQDTKGLTLAEHGAYTLLLDHYYFNGSLPSNAMHLHTICNARDEQEKAAVDRVVAIYFTEDGEKLIQKRVEEELENVLSLSVKRKEAAQARWNCNASAFQKQSTWNAQGGLTQHNTAQHSTSASGACPADAGPSPSVGDISLPEKPIVTTVDSIDRERAKNRELRQNAKAVLAYLNKTVGKGFQEVDANLEPIMGRLREGANAVQVKSVIIDRWQAWGSDEKMHEYLRPQTLFRKSNFWGYLGNITAAPAGDSSRAASPSNVDLPLNFEGAEHGDQGD